MEKLKDLHNNVMQKMTWSMEILPQNVTDISFMPDARCTDLDPTDLQVFWCTKM